jgi:hypothetical protein
MTIPEMVFAINILLIFIIGFIVLLRNKLVRLKKNKKGYWTLKVVPHVRRRELLDISDGWKHYEGVIADLNSKMTVLEMGIALLNGNCFLNITRRFIFCIFIFYNLFFHYH